MAAAGGGGAFLRRVGVVGLVGRAESESWSWASRGARRGMRLLWGRRGSLLLRLAPPLRDSDIVVGVFGNILMVVAILSSSRLSVCMRMHVCVCVRARGLTVKAVYERFKYY